jgi:hypothetical protein
MGLRKSEELTLCGMVTHSYMRVQVNNTHLLYPCSDRIENYRSLQLGGWVGVTVLLEVIADLYTL